MFKRKYKKSEWFKGLLEAEELYKKGWVLTCSLQAPFDPGKRQGIYSYVMHRAVNAELFQETPNEQL